MVRSLWCNIQTFLSLEENFLNWILYPLHPSKRLTCDNELIIPVKIILTLTPMTFYTNSGLTTPQLRKITF